MFDSVQARQRGAFDFGTQYDSLCQLQNIAPNPVVKTYLQDGVLELNADRIKLSEWDPILNSIRVNKSLRWIVLHSSSAAEKHQTAENGSEQRRPAKDGSALTCFTKDGAPPIRSNRDLTYRACRSLKDCLGLTQRLTNLELNGLPLRERDVIVLDKGIAANHSVRRLSLAGCKIGDCNVEIICKTVKTAGNIEQLDLSGCSLTWRSADAIAAVIKYQAMRRHNEAWKDTLRYRVPVLDTLRGLRRITLNGNPLLDDRGACVLAEAITDDLWMRAIDLHNCGLSDRSANAFLTALRHNRVLTVLDLRLNPLISRDTLKQLLRAVLQNNAEAAVGDADADAESQDGSAAGAYKWIKIERTPAPARARARAAALAYAHAQPGLPWRTAARSVRDRGYPPPSARCLDSRYLRVVPAAPPVRAASASASASASAAPTARSEAPENDVPLSARQTGSDRSTPEQAEKRGTEAERGGTLEAVQREVRALRTELELERELHRRAHEQMVELARANEARARQLDELGELTARVRFLKDSKALDTLAEAFRQFDGFVQHLEHTGFSSLVRRFGVKNTLDEAASLCGLESTRSANPRELVAPEESHQDQVVRERVATTVQFDTDDKTITQNDDKREQRAEANDDELTTATTTQIRESFIDREVDEMLRQAENENDNDESIANDLETSADYREEEFDDADESARDGVTLSERDRDLPEDQDQNQDQDQDQDLQSAPLEQQLTGDNANVIAAEQHHDDDTVISGNF